MNRPRRHFEIVWVLSAVFSLICAVVAGLQRAGIQLHTQIGTHDFHPDHGTFMVTGFLLTLISLERAVALQKTWGYLAPLFALGAAISSLFQSTVLSGVSASLSAGTLVFVLGSFWRKHRDPHEAVLLLGAVLAWVAASLHIFGFLFPQTVTFWMGFFALTIFGERLELSRVVFHQPSRVRHFLSWTGIALVGVGSVVGIIRDEMLAVGYVLLCLWILLFDVTKNILRGTQNTKPLPRYIAVCLLSGALWMGLSGVLLLFYPQTRAGLVYDAILHSFFLGFVFSMIFAHAPIIFPAVLKKEIPFHARFYGHWILLQMSLILRVYADLVSHSYETRKWAALANAAAIAVFMLNMLLSIVQGFIKSGAKRGT